MFACHIATACSMLHCSAIATHSHVPLDATAGGITTVLLLSYLCVFGQQVGSNWTIGRQLAAYALGIMGLVALNGVIAVLWMAAGCFGTSRDSSTADDDVEIAAVAPDGYQPIAATEKYKAGGNGKDSQRVCVMVTAA